jgi:DNA-binding IclR family transcriptional regulator
LRKTYCAPSVIKAFRILEEISKAPFSLGISDLSKSLRMGKSTIHGITSALVETGLIERDWRTKKFGLGEALLKLSVRVQGVLRLPELARPCLEKLVEQTHETAFLGILKDDHLSIVSIEEGPGDMKITSPLGITLPMFAGATGKLILAYMSPDRAGRIIVKKGLPAYTDKTIQDTDLYFREVEEVRERGYALDDEEYLVGVRAVAAPFFQGGSMVGAIWVVGFVSRINQEKMPLIIEETLKAAKAVSTLLDVISRVRTG